MLQQLDTTVKQHTEKQRLARTRLAEYLMAQYSKPFGGAVSIDTSEYDKLIESPMWWGTT